MAAAGLIVAVLFVLILVPFAAGGFFGIHSHAHLNSNNKKEEDQESGQSNEKLSQQELEYYAATTKKTGLRSFTHGHGGYKSMPSEFLAAHNAIRARYGVPALRWSNKLAKYARRWSSKRRIDCLLMHSFASPYGENVFRGTGWDWKAADAVRGWASEASYFDWKAQACYPGHVCGHFTQLVWNDTQLVGCGRAECFFGGVFITCEYEPGGNWKGEAPLT